MTLKSIIAAACTLATVSNVFGGVITFDSAPITGNDLGGFYSGVTFQFEEQVTAATAAFPATSGTHVLTGFNSSFAFNFTSQQTSLSFFYTSLNGFSGAAYDSFGNQDYTFTGAAGTGAASQIVLSGHGGISSVVLTDAQFGVPGVPDVTAIDSLSAPGINELSKRTIGSPAKVPEVSNTLGLFAVAGIALMAFRRKVAVQQ